MPDATEKAVLQRPPREAGNGKHAVLFTRLDSLMRAIESRNFADIEFEYDRVLRAAEKLDEPESDPHEAGLPADYTVVLLYPDYATGDYGSDIFVDSAHVKEPFQAAEEVQKMASFQTEIRAEDFKPVAVFRGDCHMELSALDF